VMGSAPGARTLIDGLWRDYFSGTGYLGLQGHPGLLAAAGHALQVYGLTTATSRGGYGEHPVFHDLEEAAAAFLGEERSLYTVSAYLGSGILLQGLRGEYERVYVDESAHTSVREAVAACELPAHVFCHCDPARLADALRLTLQPRERPLVLTDGVFPISGRIAPVLEYLDILSSYAGSILSIDDAHATGALGRNGRGTLEYLLEAGESEGNAEAPGGEVRCYTAHTLSKALAGHGGVIAGPAALIEQLWRNAPALAGSSPSPIPAAAASAWSLRHVAAHTELREKLWRNVARARQGFRTLGWPLEESPAPIVCLPSLPGLNLQRLQAELFDRDICVAHVTRYSSTPKGGALRIAIFATHTEEQIDLLIATVRELL
jgi:8-amino-7-oxononanoate synthase